MQKECSGSHTKGRFKVWPLIRNEIAMLWLCQEAVKSVRIVGQSSCVQFCRYDKVLQQSWEPLRLHLFVQNNIFVWSEKGMLSGKYLKVWRFRKCLLCPSGVVWEEGAVFLSKKIAKEYFTLLTQTHQITLFPLYSSDSDKHSYFLADTDWVSKWQ